MQIRTIQKLGLLVVLAGGIACNKGDPEHERSAASAAGDERAEASTSEPDGPAQQQASVPAHQAEPNSAPRSNQEGQERASGSAGGEAEDVDKVASDNTGRNQRDQSGDTLTPMDQGESERDIEITRRIREAMVGNEALSFMAKNAKVITRNGRVTLRGPVHSDDEREVIEAAARSVAGPSQVVSQLEVK